MRHERVRLCVSRWSVVLPFFILVVVSPGAARGAPPARDDKGSDKGEAKPKPEGGESKPAGGEAKPEATGKTQVPKPSIDDDYVRENLEGFLHPTKVEHLKDGRVKLLFDFRKKSEDHVDIFTPRIGSGYSSTFRWSIPDEEHWSAASGDDIGLRISNTGTVLLNCWFTDDVEAEMTFLNRLNFTPRMYVSLFFANEKSAGIGTNFGTQVARFSAGKPGGAKGAVESVVNDASVKMKLVVRGGTFEAHRNGKSRESMAYTKKSFASGRLGFSWGGNIMGFVSQMEIVGKLDAQKMAKVMQKGRRP